MDQLVIYLILLMSATVVKAEDDQGNCHCAVLSEGVQEPILERTLSFNVTCDDDGAEKCRLLCLALAQGAQERAPAMICEKLKIHVENLMVSVHTKSCDADSWKYSGLKGSEPICCHEGKVASCNEAISTVDGEH